MCLYRVFSVLCMGYMLVGIKTDLEDSTLLLIARYSSTYDVALELNKVAGIRGLFSQALLRFRHIIQAVV